jgi:hypothetical protein
MWDVGYEMWDVKETVLDLTSDLLVNSLVESRIRLKLVNDLEAA